MKRVLVVLAATATCGGVSVAAAQPAGVQLYGIVDLGYTYTDPKASGQSSTSALTSGTQSGSRFGVRGSETLDGGWRATFQLESGINADTGTLAQGGRLFGRQAWVGLAGPYGELRLGRQESAGFEVASLINPFGTSWNDASLASTFSSADGLRLDNAIMYRSPTIGGFSGMIGYSANVSGAEVAGTGNNSYAITAGGVYRVGALTLAGSYEGINCPDATTTPAAGPCSAQRRDNQKQWQLGGSYDFGLAKAFLAYGQERDHGQTLGGSNAALLTGDANVVAAGISVPIGAHTVLAGFQMRTDETSGRSDDAKQELDVWSLGYTYTLSKRTNLWAYVNERRGDKGLDQDLNFDRRQFGLGLRHMF